MEDFMQIVQGNETQDPLLKAEYGEEKKVVLIWDFTEEEREKLRRLSDSMLVGLVHDGAVENPELTLGSWYVFTGGTLNWNGGPFTSSGIVYVDSFTDVAHWKLVPFGGTDVIVEVGDADAFDPNKEGGYGEGEIVSYVNTDSPDPKYHTIAVYVSETQIGYVGEYPNGYVASPEQNDAWIWNGDQVVIPSGSTANSFVENITSLRLISAPQNGHTVSVKSTATVYKFYSSFSIGIRPFDGTAGCWYTAATLPLQNKLLSVITTHNSGEMLYMPESFKVLTLEDNVEFAVMDEAGDDMITLVIPKPSVITRISSGYTLADFKIVPIGGSTTTITVDDADVFDPQKEDGYTEGAIVSYVNPDSPDPKYNTIAVYVAETQINYVGIPPNGEVASPEQNDAWIWQGEEVAVPSGTGSTSFVPTTTALQQIIGYKSGDTVSVINGRTYRYQYVNAFYPGVDLYPFDQIGNPNYCWTYRWANTDLGAAKINYSGLRYVVFGDEYDGASMTIDYDESVLVLDATQSVFINGVEFTQQGPFIVYNRSGEGLTVIQFGNQNASGLPSTWEADTAAIAALTTHEDNMDIGSYADTAIFEYDAASTATPNADIIKPNDVTGAGRWIKQKVFTLLGHLHAISDVLGLQTALDGINAAIAAFKLETGDRHGFVYPVLPTVSFNDATRTITKHAGSGYDVKINGTKYRITTDKSVQIGTGLNQHFIWYYLNNGVPTLGTAQTPWDILDLTKIPVRTVHWDGVKGILANEMHDARRNLLEHKKQHDTDGARYVNGFDATFLSNNTFSTQGGVIRDEELYLSIASKTQLAVGYRTAGNASMVFDAPATGYAKLSGGFALWDNNGVLTPISNNNYAVYYIYATNRDYPANYELASIMGRGDYTSVANAQAAPLPPLVGFSVAEWKLLYRVIVRRTNANPFAFIQADDKRSEVTGLAVTGGNIGTVIHNNTTNRDAAGAHPSAAISLTTVPIGSTAGNADEAFIELYAHTNATAEKKHATNQITNLPALTKLALAANTNVEAILAAIDTFLAGTINANSITDAGWLETEQRLAVLQKLNGIINVSGAAMLLDIFGPPDNATALLNQSSWTNETKTLTGDNSLGQLGQKGQHIWLSDGTYAECTDATIAVSGSAIYKRNRAVDVMDPVNNTQDAALINQLDPSYTYPSMTPTGVSADSGWNTSTNIKIISGLPARWGMWFIGGLNGEGWHFECFLVVGTTSYWKRIGSPESFSICITSTTHPTLISHLLAYDFTASTYAQIAGDEVSDIGQTYWHAATRSKYEKQLDGKWEKIR
jgi:hypothetical protein